MCDSFHSYAILCVCECSFTAHMWDGTFCVCFFTACSNAWPMHQRLSSLHATPLQITQHVPEHGVFGEEHGLKFGSQEGSSFMWVLDPIDGTKSFITGVQMIWRTCKCLRGWVLCICGCHESVCVCLLLKTSFTTCVLRQAAVRDSHLTAV